MRSMSLLSVIILTIVIMVAIMFTSVALQGGEPAPTPYPTVAPLAIDPNEAVTPPLATQVAEYAARAQAAAEDALRAADDVTVQVSAQLDTANMLLGLFQNVTAISGIIIPLLAALAGYYGINRLNELQKQVEDARTRFEKDISDKQAELDKLRQQLETTAEVQRDSTAKANLALSFLALGDRQYRSQDFAGALDTFRQALELDPDSLITHYRLGYVYTQSGNLELAETHLTRALEIKSDFAPALAALGYVYRRIGEKMPAGIERDAKLNEAERYLLRGLTLSPKLIDEDDESWWGSLGGLYRRRGQIDEAIRAYERAAAVTPASSYAFSNLALLYMQKRRRDEMVRTYERVEQLAAAEVQADVDNYWAYADLLTARLALRMIKPAESVLQMVLERAPVDSPYVFESLIDTLTRLMEALTPEEGQHIPAFIERIRAQQEINKELAVKKE